MDAVLQALIGAVVGVGFLAFIDKKITERFVKWFSFLTGDWITAASIAIGWGLAFLFPGIDPTEAINTAVGSPLTDIPYWATRLLAGIFIGLAAGELADRQEARTGAVVVPGEGQVAGAVVRTAPFDEGYNPGDPGYAEWAKNRG